VGSGPRLPELVTRAGPIVKRPGLDDRIRGFQATYAAAEPSGNGREPVLTRHVCDARCGAPQGVPRPPRADPRAMPSEMPYRRARCRRAMRPPCHRGRRRVVCGSRNIRERARTRSRPHEDPRAMPSAMQYLKGALPPGNAPVTSQRSTPSRVRQPKHQGTGENLFSPARRPTCHAVRSVLPEGALPQGNAPAVSQRSTPSRVRQPKHQGTGENLFSPAMYAPRDAGRRRASRIRPGRTHVPCRPLCPTRGRVAAGQCVRHIREVAAESCAAAEPSRSRDGPEGAVPATRNGREPVLAR